MEGKYTGRKRIPIDAPMLNEVMSAYSGGKIAEPEAISRLGVSRATFYRRLKEFVSLI